MSVDKERIKQALVSYQSLAAVISSLSEDEVLAALELESSSNRRPSLICRLLQRAVRLNEIKYRQHLIRSHLNGEEKICDFE